MNLSRRSLIKITAMALAFAMLPIKSANSQTPHKRFGWNRRVLRAEWIGNKTKAIYYKKHQMARYRPYV
jgi:hypothetical protein